MADKEDVTAQLAAVARARDDLASAVLDLEHAARAEGLPGVAVEARAVAKRLTSRAKKPPPPDTTALAGEVSAAYRPAVRSDEFDAAVEAFRHAEQAHDAAVYDLATTRGDEW